MRILNGFCAGVVGCLTAACANEAPPPVDVTSVTEKAPTPPRLATMRLRVAALDDPTQRATYEAVAHELSNTGFSIVGEGEQYDMDVLLAVRLEDEDALEAGVHSRTTVKLSSTIREHVMEDVTGHFAFVDGRVDMITVREMCERLRRRVHRFNEAAHPGAGR